jgi:hypothetical protein
MEEKDELMIDLVRNEIKEGELWVSLKDIASLILHSSEQFVEEEQWRAYNPDYSDSFLHGFSVCASGLLMALTNFGISKEQIHKLNDMEDFMRLTK